MKGFLKTTYLNSAPGEANKISPIFQFFQEQMLEHFVTKGFIFKASPDLVQNLYFLKFRFRLKKNDPFYFQRNVCSACLGEVFEPPLKWKLY